MTSLRPSRRQFLRAIAAAPPLMRTTFVLDSEIQGGKRTGDVYLIAHRGGVVDDQHPENSVSSLEAAIARGYWMLEVDVRRSRDGQAVMQHDPTFERFYGDPRRVDEMTWNEISQLRAQPGGHRPITFDELCQRCGGRIRLMLDIKGTSFPDEFYRRMIDSLRTHNLLETTYCLTADRVHVLTDGVARRAMNREALAAAVARGEPVAARNYLFELGRRLDDAALELCRKHDVIAVAAINAFRYEQAKEAPLHGARSDIERLRAMGVQYYQIDSMFDRFLRG